MLHGSEAIMREALHISTGIPEPVIVFRKKGRHGRRS